MPELSQVADQAFKESEAKITPPVADPPQKDEPVKPIVDDTVTDDVEEPDEVEEVELEEEEPEVSKKAELPPANQYVYDRLPTMSVKGKLANGTIREYKF